MLMPPEDMLFLFNNNVVSENKKSCTSAKGYGQKSLIARSRQRKARNRLKRKLHKLQRRK